MCRGAPGLNRRTKYQRVGAPGKPGIVGCSVTLGNLGAVGSQGAVGNPGAVGSSGAVGNPGAVGSLESSPGYYQIREVVRGGNHVIWNVTGVGINTQYLLGLLISPVRITLFT